MANGGNSPWKDFFDHHETNHIQGRTFDECTIQERYDSEAGEEWKERLTAKVEGKEYVPGTKPPPTQRPNPTTESLAATSRTATPVSSRPGGPPSRNPTPLPSGQKAQNEAYFARMGAENSSRPDGLPPNQGGKFAGFGSDPMPTRSSSSTIPAAEDFQKDPVAALTKGFGWLSSTVTKQVNTGYEGWVKPNMQKVRLRPPATFRHMFSPHPLTIPPARRGRPRCTSPHDRCPTRPNPPSRHQKRRRHLQPIRRGRRPFCTTQQRRPQRERPSTRQARLLGILWRGPQRSRPGEEGLLGQLCCCRRHCTDQGETHQHRY